MGIPSLFSFLSRNYNNIIIKGIPHIDNFYFDLNCLIHPQCNKIIRENPNWNNRMFLEDLMIKQIKEYMSEIINYVSPKKLLYISIDGPAPLAKIKQQRDRRFKSIKEKQFVQNVKKQFEMETQNIWDTNVITPGTEFMNKLKKELILYINHELKFKGTVIFSSADSAGEGEHKILDYIRKNKHKNESDCIYGLDADLIILSMASQATEIYLLRENMNNTKQSNLQEFIIVSIEILKSSLVQTILENIIDSHKYNENNLIQDFILYCFMLGNDFVPSIPSLRIRDGSITRLISIYSSILNELNTYLINNGKVNSEFLLQLFESLSLIETETLKTYTGHDTKNVPKYSGNDPYDEIIYNFENNLPKDKDVLQLGYSDFKYRYYMKYCNICYEDEKKYIENICKNYLNTMRWVYNYYFDKCIDWRWCYKYYAAPFISDLYNYIQKYPDVINNLTVFNMDSKPFTSTQQLLLVLPTESNHILPTKYKHLQKGNSPIFDLYPTQFTELSNNKRFRWQNIPKLPKLDYTRIIDQVKEKYRDESNIILEKHN